MATVKADGLDTRPVKAGIGVHYVVGKYTFAELIPASTVIQMVKVPAGATVFDVAVHTPDLDSSTNVTYSVGDGDSANRYINASTKGQTGGTARSDRVAPIRKYDTEDTIDITMGAADTTTTSGVIYCTVGYTMNDA